MISRVINAVARGLLMGLVVALPALVLPGVSIDGAQITLFVALLAAVFTFVEYVSTYPSLVEFRDAAPFNRMRYFMLLIIVGSLTAVKMALVGTGPVAQMTADAASRVGALFDMPFSPVRLVLIATPTDTDIEMLYAIRDGAALSYAVALVGVAAFYLLVRVYDWPARNGAFNVWVNLPLFDPTTGGDVVPRLRWDGYINIALGGLMPFLLPAVAVLGSGLFDIGGMFESQTFVWSLAAWSFLPASMIMRGIAMCRIAELIEAKRQRTYAQDVETLG